MYVALLNGLEDAAPERGRVAVCDLDEALTVDHPGGTAVFWSLPAA